MTISQVVRALEKSGYLARIPHQKDTRSKVIRVTTAGRELAEQAVQVVEATDRKFFMPLEDNGQSLVTLFRKLLR